MKKSLIIFLSLIFMSMSAYAVGVDCWEEVDATFSPNTVSKMQDVLGDKVTITRVKTELKIIAGSTSNYAIAASCSSSSCIYRYPELREITLPINQYLVTTDSSKNVYYLEVYNTPADQSVKNSGTYTSGLIFNLYNDRDLMLQNPFVRRLTTTGSTSGTPMYTHDYDANILGASYIHTYCIANTNSGGGSGGNAGAAVNYIIKAK